VAAATFLTIKGAACPGWGEQRLFCLREKRAGRAKRRPAAACVKVDTSYAHPRENAVFLALFHICTLAYTQGFSTTFRRADFSFVSAVFA